MQVLAINMISASFSYQHDQCKF